MRTLVFDIETVPDVDSGRRIHNLGDDVGPEDVARAMQQIQYQKSNTDFLPKHLHKVVAIAALLQEDEKITLWSLGSPDSDEADLVGRFFTGLEELMPRLVSWNGGGFDLPVLHYRALLHGVRAPLYWEKGDRDPSFRWDNYLNRYHWRHLDLMDVLSGFYRGAPLDDIAKMLGFPGKISLAGDAVWDAWLAGRVADIRNYCEHDVLNTYLVYLRFQLMRGRLDDAGYARACERLRKTLAQPDKPHLQEFLDHWPE